MKLEVLSCPPAPVGGVLQFFLGLPIVGERERSSALNLHPEGTGQRLLYLIHGAHRALVLGQGDAASAVKGAEGRARRTVSWVCRQVVLGPVSRTHSAAVCSRHTLILSSDAGRILSRWFCVR